MPRSRSPPRGSYDSDRRSLTSPASPLTGALPPIGVGAGRRALSPNPPSRVSRSPSPMGGRTIVANDYDFYDLESQGKGLARLDSKVGPDTWSKPFPPADTKAPHFNLGIRNLSYKVVSKKEDKVILSSVSAEAKAGEILAVAGPSGAGKSTLIDALGGRIAPSSLQGNILVNGHPIDRSFKRQSAYVMQDDALLPMLTVQETLLFSARLRLPSSVPYSEKVARVEQLLKELGLEDCAKTLIGNEQVRGVSGGEKRRVSIGVELIHDPSILLLDEPTSGLDSVAALNVVKILQRMAEVRRRTIVLSIHQPSFRILQSLHRLLILAKGRVVYHGPTQDLGSYLSEFGKPVAKQANVLEYALDVVEETQESRDGLDRLIAFQRAETKALPRSDTTSLADRIGAASFATSMLEETGTLMLRNLINTLRTPELFFARVVIMISTGLTMGSLFWMSGTDAEGIQNRASFFAFTLAIHLFTSTEALPIFLGERSVFVRETSRGAYRSSSYVIANAIITIPFLLILAAIYAGISYFMVGLASGVSEFLFYTLTLFMTLAVANSFVIGLSAFVPNFILGNTIITAVTAYFFLFSGFYIPKERIPNGWIWLNYISTFKYPYEAFTWNEYTSDYALSSCYGPIVDSECTVTAKSVLRSQDLGRDHKWVNIGVLALMFVLYRLVFYIGLRLQSRQTRK